MSSSGKFLATIALANQILYISMSRRPLKPMTKSLSYKRLRAGMMAAISFMNLP